MKIIGIASEDYNAQYIVSIGESEIARIAGFTYSGDDYRKHMRSLTAMDDRSHLRIGVEIPVSAIWERHEAIRSKQAELTKLAGTMRSLADLIENASPAAILDLETKA